MKDGLKYAGKMTLTLRGPDGKVKETRYEDNTVLSAGLAWLLKITMDDSLTAMNCFYIGCTTSGATVTQTEGTAETVEVYRKEFTFSSGAAVGQGSATSTFGASGAGGDSTTGITEAGIFNGVTGNASSGDGVLLARSVFAAVDKGELDSLEIKWDIAYS